jgi:hypothetical protein
MNGSLAAGQRSVLLLARWYPPENASGAARPYRFARYLPRFGYEPRVVAAALKDEPPEKDKVRRTPAAHSPFRDRLFSRVAQGMQRWLLPYNDQLPWTPHAVAAAIRWWREQPFETVFSTSPPVAAHLAAMELKRRLGVRWVADFRDPLRDNPFRTHRWIFPYDAIVEREILRRADAVVANTDAMANLWRARYPQWQRKIHTIWNGYDPADEIAAAPIDSRRPYRVIAHVGTLYGGRHPAALLASLERLIARGSLAPDAIHVHLTGVIENGLIERHRDTFEALARRGLLEYGGLLPPAEARRVLATSDYLLLLDLNERDTGLQVPGKIFEYIRIGRPILVFTAAGSPVHEIMKNSGIPHRFVFTGATPADTDREVLSFLGLPTAPARPSEWFRDQFDCIAQTATLARLLRGV